MDYARRNQQIANSFYNLGLEKSRIIIGYWIGTTLEP